MVILHTSVFKSVTTCVKQRIIPIYFICSLLHSHIKPLTDDFIGIVICGFSETVDCLKLCWGAPWFAVLPWGFVSLLCAGFCVALSNSKNLYSECTEETVCTEYFLLRPLVSKPFEFSFDTNGSRCRGFPHCRHAARKTLLNWPSTSPHLADTLLLVFCITYPISSGLLYQWCWNWPNV